MILYKKQCYQAPSKYQSCAWGRVPKRKQNSFIERPTLHLGLWNSLTVKLWIKKLKISWATNSRSSPNTNPILSWNPDSILRGFLRIEILGGIEDISEDHNLPNKFWPLSIKWRQFIARLLPYNHNLYFFSVSDNKISFLSFSCKIMQGSVWCAQVSGLNCLLFQTDFFNNSITGS